MCDAWGKETVVGSRKNYGWGKDKAKGRIASPGSAYYRALGRERERRKGGLLFRVSTRFNNTIRYSNPLFYEGKRLKIRDKKEMETP